MLTDAVCSWWARSGLEGRVVVGRKYLDYELGLVVAAYSDISSTDVDYQSYDVSAGICVRCPVQVHSLLG